MKGGGLVRYLRYLALLSQISLCPNSLDWDAFAGGKIGKISEEE